VNGATLPADRNDRFKVAVCCVDSFICIETPKQWFTSSNGPHRPCKLSELTSPGLIIAQDALRAVSQLRGKASP